MADARMLVQLSAADLEALIERRLAAAIAELATDPAAPPALVDRKGLAKALSTSVKTVDRLRAEPGFPEPIMLFDAPRFCVADVVAFIRARCAGPGLRVVGGGK
jgi:hypothetical protein